MRTIIAGTRSLTDYTQVSEAIRKSGFSITEVVSGCASGADTFGENWAKHCDLPVTRFPADWQKHGRAAGYIRNARMAEYAEALIAVWDGKSAGTRNMIDEALNRKLPVYVHRYGENK